MSPAARKPLRLLLVAYFYPPGRDTGTLRPAGMARHLRGLGHDVTVLSTGAFGYGSEDEEQVIRAADAQRLRARLRGKDRIDALFESDRYSGKPHPLSKVLVPEPLVAAWAPFARRAARRAHRREPFDAVITTSPPESAHTIGLDLQARGSAWIADIRDAWTFEPLRPPFPLAAQRRLDERLERGWLGAADAVVCVSRPAADDLRERGIADPVVIPNGWDAKADGVARAKESGVKLDPKRTSLVYTGRFGSYGRDPAPLVRAMAHLAADDAKAARKLELVIAGPLTPAEAELFATDVSPARIVLAGSLERGRALALQREAGALLLIASPARSQLANYKLFEYLAAGRPILALAAGTEAGRIVAEAGGETVRADDEEAIATALRALAEAKPKRPGAQSAVQKEHSYPRIAQRMADVVAGAIERRNSGRAISLS